MKKYLYNYKTIFSPYIEDSIGALNELGQEGWLLIGSLNETESEGQPVVEGMFVKEIE